MRTVTSRGQFSPLHLFQGSLRRGEKATTLEEFTNMITNPGPLRVTFSADYLDWYFRAYQDKVAYKEKRDKAAAKLEGARASALMVGAPELGVPAGMFMRPPNSCARKEGVALKERALQMIEEGTVSQGKMDCFERQPQFPAIHIDKCTDYHVRELVQQLIVDAAMSADEVWEKALMYAAILKERHAHYPSSFSYIQTHVSEIVFATEGPDPQDPKITRLFNEDKFPSKAAFNYFIQNVKRYHIENAVEAHVFLTCHRLPDADRILFSEPPPKELSEAAVALPTSYPSLEALLENDGNAALLRVLLFGELNTVVTQDPFVKFPTAAPFVQRPHANTDTSNQSTAKTQTHSVLSGKLTSELVADARKGFAALPQNIKASIDGRANDIARLQRTHSSSDLQFGAKELMKASDANPAEYALNGGTGLNPRAVRAEIRDEVTRSVLKGIQLYEVAKEKQLRRGYDEVRAMASTHVTQRNRLPESSPTIPRFVALIHRDPTFSMLLSSAAVDSATKSKLDSLSRQVARCLFTFSMEYHVESLRRVNRQKFLVAAAVLDEMIQSEVQTILTGSSTLHTASAVVLRQLPTFAPFTKRMISESGLPSEARFEDFMRWMKPLQK